jgi:hypothetical protein
MIATGSGGYPTYKYWADKDVTWIIVAIIMIWLISGLLTFILLLNFLIAVIG